MCAEIMICARGLKAEERPIIADVQASGATSLRAIAAGLNQCNVPTARGGAWSAMQVKRVLEQT